MQPPENPYSGFPGPNDPIPPGGFNQPPGFPPPGFPPPGAPRKPEISFDVISEAWNVIQPHLGTYIGATAIIMAVGFLFGVVQQVVTPTNANGVQEFSVVPLLISLISNIIYQLMGAGMIRMAINHLRTGRPDFGNMFSILDVSPSLIVAWILMFLAIIIGLALCCVPGFLIGGLCMFVTPLIADRRAGPIDAFQMSFKALQPQMWMALLFSFVLGLIASAGVIACCIGLLITVPLANMSIAITYRNFFDGNAGPMIGNQTSPVAPIADPRF